MRYNEGITTEIRVTNCTLYRTSPTMTKIEGNETLYTISRLDIPVVYKL